MTQRIHAREVGIGKSENPPHGGKTIARTGEVPSVKTRKLETNPHRRGKDNLILALLTWREKSVKEEERGAAATPRRQTPSHVSSDASDLGRWHDTPAVLPSLGWCKDKTKNPPRITAERI